MVGEQRPAITKHLKNIFQSIELEEEVVSSIMEQTTRHGTIEGIGANYGACELSEMQPAS